MSSSPMDRDAGPEAQDDLLFPEDPERIQARAAWRAAMSFADLCALSARFLRGETCHFPGWMAKDLDEESDEILPTLLACQRAGFLTTASQPGRPWAPGHDGQEWAQRAFVAGFIAEPVARSLEQLALASDLLILTHRANEEGGTPLPVGLRGATPYLWAGHAAGAEELEIFAEDLNTSALESLAATRHCWVIDPEWGRRDHLWRLLDDALAGTST